MKIRSLLLSEMKLYFKISSLECIQVERWQGEVAAVTQMNSILLS